MFPRTFIFSQEQGEGIVENHSKDMSIIPSEGDNEGSESNDDQSQESTHVEE
jgi:hypothetical protein